MLNVDWNFEAIKGYFVRHGYTFQPMPLLSADAISASDGLMRIVLEGRDKVTYSAIVCDSRDLKYASDTMNTLAGLILGEWDVIPLSETTTNFRVNREGVEILFVHADAVERAIFSVRPQ